MLKILFPDPDWQEPNTKFYPFPRRRPLNKFKLFHALKNTFEQIDNLKIFVDFL